MKMKMLAAFPFAVAAAAASPQSDDFSAPSLDGALWNTAGASDVTISVAGGMLEIDIPSGGTNHDLTHSNQRAGVVWQDVTDSDVNEMEVELRLGPTPDIVSGDDPLDVAVREQMVGIYVKGVDSGYWIRPRLHTHLNGNCKVKVESIEPGGTTRITPAITISYVPKTLKLTRNGNSYQYLYSTSDGSGFDTLPFTSDMAVAGLGVFAGNKRSKPSFRARFESFDVTVAGTASPTDDPTRAPSEAPSVVPTSLPSSDPTPAPSRYPSAGPSSGPSGGPTAMPQIVPSAHPSSVPSSAPSESFPPSGAPSDVPSFDPSDVPSDPPTDLPSFAPSALPSRNPSDSPSRLPSDGPTVDPTTSPSASPSDAPSPSPNQVASCAPSPSVYGSSTAECSVDFLPSHASGATPRSVLSFYVMGDTPYDSPTSNSDKECLQGQLRGLDLSGADSPSFVVHVGDFKAGSLPCYVEDFTNVRNMFTHPANALNYRVEDVFFLPGDNEWNDCDNFDEATYPGRLDEPAATALWRSTFAPGPDLFGTLSGTTRMTTTPVVRQSNRIENFAFFVTTGVPNADSGIAVLALSLVAGEVDDEAQVQIDNVAWTETKLADYDAAHDMRAIVLFGHHSLPSEVRDVLENATYVDLPLMYLQGNNHDFCVERPWSADLPKAIRLTVEDGDNADPLRIDVSMDPTNACADYVFEVDRRLGTYVDGTNECPSVDDEDTWTTSGTSPRPTASAAPSASPMPTSNPTSKPTPAPAPEWTTIAFDDFEAGWGNFVDGGADAARYTGSRYPIGGYALEIRDNTGTSVVTYQNSHDVTMYTELRVSFFFYAVSMDNSNEDFWLQYSDDGGSTWTTKEAWAVNTDFVNNQGYQVTVTFLSSANGGDVPFTSTFKIRFRCDASGNQDWVYIDNVLVEGK